MFLRSVVFVIHTIVVRLHECVCVCECEHITVFSILAFHITQTLNILVHYCFKEILFPGYYSYLYFVFLYCNKNVQLKNKIILFYICKKIQIITNIIKKSQSLSIYMYKY